jgi:uncharacterized metal-binding protein
LVNCAGCIIHCCSKGEECAQGQDLKAYEASSRRELEKAENKKLLEVAARIEGEHYMEWTRLEEICGFAEQIGYKRIGLAHCIGLTNEAKFLKDVLEKKGFLVESICCKFSGIDKRDFNLTQINCERHEVTCNPIGQAMVLNDLQTDLNIIVGLCIGHDILFTKYSEAPVTTFIVKDRVTGHNPAIALYASYYRKKFNK